MAYSAKSDAAGTINQFTRRKDIKITTGGTSTPVNYQVKVTVAYEPEMQSLFQDIRFNTKTGVYIDYWIESSVESDTADVWLELPDAIADPGSDTIRMYYGNAAASDGGNGNNTFIQFNSGSTFDGTTEIIPGSYSAPTWSIEDNAWKVTGNGRYASVRFFNNTVGNNYILEANIKSFVETGVGNTQYGLKFDDSLATDEWGFARWLEVDDMFSIIKTGGVDVSAAGSISTGWNKWKFTKNNNDLALFYNDVLKVSTTDTTDGSYVGTYFLVYDTNNTVWYSNIRVRKYIANEPTAAVGTAQHQRRVPIFL